MDFEDRYRYGPLTSEDPTPGDIWLRYQQLSNDYQDLLTDIMEEKIPGYGKMLDTEALICLYKELKNRGWGKAYTSSVEQRQQERIAELKSN